MLLALNRSARQIPISGHDRRVSLELGNPPFIDSRLVPQLAGDFHRIDACGFPPGALVAGPVYLAVVRTA
jgi:hypothetical protein